MLCFLYAWLDVCASVVIFFGFRKWSTEIKKKKHEPFSHIHRHNWMMLRYFSPESAVARPFPLHSSSQCKNWYGLLLQIPNPEVLLSLHKSLPKSSYIAMVDTEELEALFHSWWLKSQEVICLQSCWESVSVTRLCNWILELRNSAVILECQRWDSHPSHSWCNGTGENGTLR